MRHFWASPLSAVKRTLVIFITFFFEITEKQFVGVPYIHRR